MDTPLVFAHSHGTQQNTYVTRASEDAAADMTRCFLARAQERIALNEDTLWSGHPGNHLIPGSDQHIHKARALALAGRSREAEEELRTHVLGPFTESCMPLGDLMLTFPGLAAGETDHYCRTLCLEDGTAVTRFDLQGVKSVRTTFASHPQPLGAEGCELAMTPLCPSRALPNCFDTSAGAIAYGDAPEKQGIRATTILRAATDGQLTAEAGSLAVTFASWLELRLVCRSNFAAFDKDPVGITPRWPGRIWRRRAWTSRR